MIKDVGDPTLTSLDIPVSELDGGVIYTVDAPHIKFSAPVAQGKLAKLIFNINHFSSFLLSFVPLKPKIHISVLYNCS